MKLVLLAIVHQLCLQAFEYRENSPSALFNQYCAITDPSPFGNLSNPSYLPFWQGYYLNGAYGKPYLLDELNGCTVRTGYSTGKTGLQGTWTSFGMEEYREQTLEGSIGFKFLQYFTAGSGWTVYNLEIHTEESTTSIWMSDARTAFTVAPAECLRFSFLQENILSLFNHRRKDLLYPGWSAGCDISPLEGLHFIWNLNRDYYGFENLFSVTANLLSFLVLRVGYARESSVSSVALVVHHKNMRIAYGMRHHGMLGTTHSMGLTVTGGIPGVKPLHFRSPRPRKYNYDIPDQPVDISRCTREELLTLPGINEDIARRLIQYRKTIGPITLKTLYQVGLEERDVMLLRQCLTGLAPDADDFSHRRDRKFRRGVKMKTGYDTSRRKLLFSRLLKEGIPSGTAIRIVELARTHRLETLIPAVRGMEDLSPQIKQTIIRICTDTLR